MFDFGRVDIDFSETVKPTMKCLALSTLQDGQTFTNTTKTVGTFGEITATAEDDWTAIVHIIREPEPVLPKTGR